MQGVKSDHPPGAIIMVTGDIVRYAVSMQSLSHLKVPPNSANIWFTGVLISKSINMAFQQIMDNPSLQWGWIMGDDHTYDPDVLLRLLDSNVDVVAPLCLNRLPPLDPTIIEHNESGGGRMKYLEDLPMDGLYRLKDNETCGDAGLLIRRHVLEIIGSPWYDHRKTGGASDADDQSFIQKVKRSGFDVHVNLDVRIGHVGHVVYTPVQKDGKWQVEMMGGGRIPLAIGTHASRGKEDWQIP